MNKMYDYNNILKYNNENPGRKTLFEILSLDPNTRRDLYTAEDIDKVVIDGNIFINYGDFQFSWEKSYVKSPVRSARGVIDNLDSYDSFVTPRLVLKFDVMSIDDFRALMQMDLSKNEFTVKCYDPIYNKTTTNKMYFATSELAKLHKLANKKFNSTSEEWEDWVELIAVEDYTVELIGTNTDVTLITVMYYLNAPEGASSTNPPFNSYAYSGLVYGDYIVVGSYTNESGTIFEHNPIVDETFNGQYRFAKWNITKDAGTQALQGNYLNGSVITVPKDGLVLYAQWDPTDEHTLTFDYGIADPVIDNTTNLQITSRQVQEGEPIGKLPLPTTPSVTVNGKAYYPYYTPQWWKIPFKNASGFDDNGNYLIVDDNDRYWKNTSSTIYLLYDISKYALSFYNNSKLYSKQDLEYNALISLPTLYQDGYTFKGWRDYNKTFVLSGGQTMNMPPYELSLYAVWEKN